MNQRNPGTEDLSQKRCFHHASREAVARCPRCRRFYCRECVTEHRGQLLCTACLAAIARGDTRPRQGLRQGLRVLAAGAGLFVAWWCFHTMGSWLLNLSDSFHEGTFWK